MKYLGLICCFIGLVSCGTKQEKTTENAAPPAALNYTDVSEFTTFSASVDSVLLHWPSFKALDERVAAIKEVVSLPDLKLLVNELLEKEEMITKEGYPTSFNEASIKSRQRLVKTYLLKIKSAIELGQDPKPTVEEFIVAFNALKDHMNLIKSPTMNLETLKDDF